MRWLVSLSLSATLIACVATDLGLPPPAPAEECDKVWLWIGPPEEAEPCPDLQVPVWEGWTEPVLTPYCGMCACGPAECVMPSKVTVHAAPICPAEEVVSTFDAGEGWNGVCAAPAAPVPADAFAAVTYEPPTLAPCVPSPTPEPPPIGARFARACPVTPGGPPEAFRTCINPEPDGSCALGFPERRELVELIDNRTCTPCACGAPEGGECTAQITLYGTAGCGDQLDSATISHTSQPACHVVPLGPLAAMRAKWTQELPGACTPTPRISAVEGTVERVGSYVKCCNKER